MTFLMAACRTAVQILGTKRRDCSARNRAGEDLLSVAAHSLPVSEPNVNVRPDTREHAAELGGWVG